MYLTLKCNPYIPIDLLASVDVSKEENFKYEGNTKLARFVLQICNSRQTHLVEFALFGLFFPDSSFSNSGQFFFY